MTKNKKVSHYMYCYDLAEKLQQNKQNNVYYKDKLLNVMKKECIGEKAEIHWAQVAPTSSQVSVPTSITHNAHGKGGGRMLP